MTSEPALLGVLMDMAVENEFIKRGYLDLYDFCVKDLGLSECLSEYYKRVAAKARAVPELREAVVSGRLKLGQARRICGVIDKENAQEWIEAGCTLTQKKLEKLVAQKNPRTKIHEGIKPIAKDLNEMKVALTEEEEASLQ